MYSVYLGLMHLKVELLLTQTKVLACKHTAGHKWRSLFGGCKVQRDKSPKGKILDNSPYIQAFQPLYHFNIKINHPHHYEEGEKEGYSTK